MQWQLLLLLFTNVITLAAVNAAASVTPDWYFCSNENSFCNSKGKIRFGANGKYFYNKGKLKESILNHSNKNRIGEEYDIEISFSEDSNTYYQSMDFNNSKYKE